MEQRHREVLRRTLVYVSQNLEVGDDLIVCLRQWNLLSDEDQERLRWLPTRHDRVRYIQKLLPLRGPTAYHTFLHALNENGQHYIAEHLEQQDAELSARTAEAVPPPGAAGSADRPSLALPSASPEESVSGAVREALRVTNDASFSRAITVQSRRSRSPPRRITPIELSSSAYEPPQAQFNVWPRHWSDVSAVTQYCVHNVIFEGTSDDFDGGLRTAWAGAAWPRPVVEGFCFRGDCRDGTVDRSVYLSTIERRARLDAGGGGATPAAARTFNRAASRDPAIRELAMSAQAVDDEKWPSAESFITDVTQWQALDQTGKTVYKMEGYKPNLKGFSWRHGLTPDPDRPELILYLRMKGESKPMGVYCDGCAAAEIKRHWDLRVKVSGRINVGSKLAPDARDTRVSARRNRTRACG